MRTGHLVFVDTGAWIALALTRDPLHSRASEAWGLLTSSGAKLHTSASIVVETFTFLDRNGCSEALGSTSWRVLGVAGGCG